MQVCARNQNVAPTPLIIKEDGQCKYLDHNRDRVELSETEALVNLVNHPVLGPAISATEDRSNFYVEKINCDLLAIFLEWWKEVAKNRKRMISRAQTASE
jgi:hypothetical protein